MGGNEITNEGVKELAKALKENTTLKSLHLCKSIGHFIGGNHISDEGLIELGEALATNNSLVELTLCNFEE